MLTQHVDIYVHLLHGFGNAVVVVVRNVDTYAKCDTFREDLERS